MRLLSMSEAFNWHSSVRRTPVEYNVIGMVRCSRLAEAASNPPTSSRLSTVGSLSGRRGNGSAPSVLGRLSVLSEDKPRAGTRRAPHLSNYRPAPNKEDADWPLWCASYTAGSQL